MCVWPQPCGRRRGPCRVARLHVAQTFPRTSLLHELVLRMGGVRFAYTFQNLTQPALGVRGTKGLHLPKIQSPREVMLQVSMYVWAKPYANRRGTCWKCEAQTA